MVGTFHLVISVGMWFAGSVVNNIWTKKMLNEGFSLPLTASVMGMAAQLLVLLFLSFIKNDKVKKETATVTKLLPISVCQISGNAFHKTALMYTAIPVVHTIKSLNSVVTAGLGFIFLGAKVPSITSLILIVIGVGIAVNNSNAFSFQDGGTDVIGAVAALLCTCADASRAVFGKSVLAPNPAERLSSLPVLAIVLSVVGVAWMELSNFYNLTILSPLTHSMTNAIRSLVVIGAGIFIGTPVRIQFVFGCVISLLGVALHNYFGKRVQSTDEKKKS